MNDIRRTVLWVIFGFSMVLLWDQWQVHNGHKATFFPTPAQQAQVAAASAAAPQAAGVPAPVVPQGTVAVPVVETRAASKELVQVETDLFKLSFDTEGGTLVRAELLSMKTSKNRVTKLCCWTTAKTASTPHKRV
jgi:YidC/Oxa1 family membrane protein insertase